MIWSDNDDEEHSDPQFDNEPVQTSSSHLLQSFKERYVVLVCVHHDNNSNDFDRETSVDVLAVIDVKIESDESEVEELLKTIEGNDFRKTCRFCFTIPTSTQIESSLTNQDLGRMYKCLTGIEVIQ